MKKTKNIKINNIYHLITYFSITNPLIDLVVSATIERKQTTKSHLVNIMEYQSWIHLFSVRTVTKSGIYFSNQ